VVASIKEAIRHLTARFGYILVREADYRRLQVEYGRLQAEEHGLTARAQQLEAEAAHAQNRVQEVEAAFAAARDHTSDSKINRWLLCAQRRGGISSEWRLLLPSRAGGMSWRYVNWSRNAQKYLDCRTKIDVLRFA